MHRLVLMISIFCFILMELSRSQEMQIPPEIHPDVQSWNDLFKPDLSNADFQEGVWTHTDGILTAGEDQVIWSQRTYDNFVLDLEFRNEEGTNSGVIVYCTDRDNWIPNSVEIQIADDFAENRCVTRWYDFFYARSRPRERELNTSSAAIVVAS